MGLRLGYNGNGQLPGGATPFISKADQRLDSERRLVLCRRPTILPLRYQVSDDLVVMTPPMVGGVKETRHVRSPQRTPYVEFPRELSRAGGGAAVHKPKLPLAFARCNRL